MLLHRLLDIDDLPRCDILRCEHIREMTPIDHGVSSEIGVYRAYRDSLLEFGSDSQSLTQRRSLLLQHSEPLYEI